jgi:hypothetical protein
MKYPFNNNISVPNLGHSTNAHHVGGLGQVLHRGNELDVLGVFEMQISRLTLVAALEGTAPRYRKMCSN